MNLSRFLATKPVTNKLSYYSFMTKKALGSNVRGIAKDSIIEYRGVKFDFVRDLDYGDLRYSLYLEESEPQTFKIMEKMSGDIFVDVGANIGGYTIRLGRKFLRVISMEPNPKAASVLRRNIEVNNLTNAQVFEVAASNASGEATLNVPSSGKTARSSLVEGYQNGKTFNVKTCTLDSLFGEYQSIDLLKIDTESAELKILEGASGTLKKTKNIVIELSSDNEVEATKVLTNNGFELIDLDKKGIGKNAYGTRTSTR